MNEKDYLGLTKKAAQDRAEGRNMVFRLVSKDGEKFLGAPSDPGRNDRVCVELTNGLVTKVEFT